MFIDFHNASVYGIDDCFCFFVVCIFLSVLLQSSQVLMGLLMDRDHHLDVLDLSGNEFSSENFEHLLLALSKNKRLSSLDMRRNPGYNEGD